MSNSRNPYWPTLGRCRRPPPFLVILCRKAYELAVRSPEGYATAAEAMQLMGSAGPAYRQEADRNLLDVLSRQFHAAKGDARKDAASAYLAKQLELAAADVDAERINEASEAYQKALPAAQAVGPAEANYVRAKLAAVKRLGELRAKAPRNGPAAAELATLLAVEFDRPSEATKIKVADQQLVRCLSLAAKEPGDLSESELLDLGDWYKARGEKATAAGRAIAYSRQGLL